MSNKTLLTLPKFETFVLIFALFAAGTGLLISGYTILDVLVGG